MKAIETEYNGLKFRSRLEARWAIAFDAMNLEYEYEPEGYELENGEKYLPDFYLTKLDTYVEVKGKRPGYENEITRLKKFITWGGPIKQIVILSEIPYKTKTGGLWHFPGFYWHGTEVSTGWFFFQGVMKDIEIETYGHFSKASYRPPRIEEWYIELQDPRFPFSIDPMDDWEENPNRIRQDITNHEFNYSVFKAFEIARKARFEYGETPVIAHGR